MTPTDVAAASAAWVWSPPGSEVVETDEYHVRLHPAWADYQQVVRFEPRRDPAVVAREVLDLVRDAGRAWVEWWVMAGSWAGGDDLVRGLGGTPSTTLHLLARDLTGDQPTPAAPPPGIVVRRTVDLAGLRDFHRVTEEVFAEPAPPDDEVVAELARADRGETWVAHDGDRPVGIAGATVVDGVARLWNGGVVESHRRRGVYRALLDARLHHAAGLGARFALVRGKVETSAPILRSSGFATYGEQRGYRIALDA